MHKLTDQICYFHIKHVDQFFNDPHKQHIMTIIKQQLKNISSYNSAYKLIPIKIVLIISFASGHKTTLYILHHDAG